MTDIDLSHILDRLDADRALSGEPSPNGDVVRWFTPDRLNCTLAYSRCTDVDIDEVIRREAALATTGGYGLEWKTYGHDKPVDLRTRLAAAGYEAEPVEKFMVLRLTSEAVNAFDAPRQNPHPNPPLEHDVRRVETLDDFLATCDDPERDRDWFGQELEQNPDSMSLYVAYVDGLPVAGARLAYNGRSEFAGLYGGKTLPAFRNQGHYIALVAARVREAYERGIAYVFIDALPTSEPIVAKRGFVAVTDTQPYIWPR